MVDSAYVFRSRQCLGLPERYRRLILAPSRASRSLSGFADGSELVAEICASPIADLRSAAVLTLLLAAFDEASFLAARSQ